MKKFLLVVVIGVLWAVGSTLAFVDENIEIEHYCSMVKANKWPDYRNIYDTDECRAVRDRQ